MISDEKRREIAASLRESREFISGLPKATLEQNAFDTFERILACVDYEHGNIFDYLADLIDRPAARNVAPAPSGHEPRAFTCELCGEWQPMDCGFAHCPNCGAEVVSDGDD